MTHYDHLDASIFQHMKSAYHAAIGERMASQIRAAIDSTVADASTIEIRARDMASGLLKKYALSIGEIRQAIREGG